MDKETQFDIDFWRSKIGERVCVPGFYWISGDPGIIVAVSDETDPKPFIVVHANNKSFIVRFEYLQDVVLPDDTLILRPNKNNEE
jgi:hypothetical protein